MCPAPAWASLGASCCLIFRSLTRPRPLLARFFVSHSLSEPILIDSFNFFEPQNPPGTSKIYEKTLGFLDFFVFSHIARDDRKSIKNAPKRLPGSFQDIPKPFPNPSKIDIWKNMELLNACLQIFSILLIFDFLKASIFLEENHYFSGLR